MNALLLIIAPMGSVAFFAAVAWWFLGRRIGGERLVVVSLAIGLAVSLLVVAFESADILRDVIATIVAALAIYGGWRLKHFWADSDTERPFFESKEGDQ